MHTDFWKIGLSATLSMAIAGFCLADDEATDAPKEPAATEATATETEDAPDVEEKAAEKPADKADEVEPEVVATGKAKPVNGDSVQVFGWSEYVLVNGIKNKLLGKLDTGAQTSSIHAEKKEFFERDGEKWVRFLLTDPTKKKPVRERIEAPLVRVARIKEPGTDPVSREVVRLSIRVGDRKARGEFTLNNRDNMKAPVLVGRNILKDLGWVDSSRTFLADEKIFR